MVSQPNLLPNQAEVHERLHLPYDLLSDEKLEFQRALRLPTFEWEGEKVLRRSMIAVREGKVIKWWYPVFPPDRGVDLLVEWLEGGRFGIGIVACFDWLKDSRSDAPLAYASAIAMPGMVVKLHSYHTLL